MSSACFPLPGEVIRQHGKATRGESGTTMVSVIRDVTHQLNRVVVGSVDELDTHHP